PGGTSTVLSRTDQYNGGSNPRSRNPSNSALGLSLQLLPLNDSNRMPPLMGPQSVFLRMKRPYLVRSFDDHGGDAVTATAPELRPSSRKVFHFVNTSTGRIASLPATLAHEL